METRADRRRAVKEQSKQNASYTLSAAQIEAMKLQATKDGTEKALTLMMYMPAMVLHDHYGFGEQRLSDFLDYMFKLNEEFNEDRISLDDMIMCLREECKLEIEIRKASWDERQKGKQSMQVRKDRIRD